MKKKIDWLLVGLIVSGTGLVISFSVMVWAVGKLLTLWLVK